MEPGFFLSYWRPWDENSSFVDNWCDYIRDRSLVDYGVSQVASYIREASHMQVAAIEEASQRQVQATAAATKMQVQAMQKIGAIQVEAIKRATAIIGYQLNDTIKELDFLNRRLDIVIEQQRAGLALQNDIVQLLKIPDSEKERQQAITLGIQFFINARKNPDLYDDALEEFLRAESMKKQDYFVLHKIGCIYMFTEKHLDVSKALDYFLRAGKYASVESDPSALRLVNILTNTTNISYTQLTSNPKRIQILAGDSYEKAALASYVLGQDDKAIEFQEKANSYNYSPENLFKLGKYMIRGGKHQKAISKFENAISWKPEMMNTILFDADTAGEPMVTDFVERKGLESEMALEDALDIVLNPSQLVSLDSQTAEQLASEIIDAHNKSYAKRIHAINKVRYLM